MTIKAMNFPFLYQLTKLTNANLKDIIAVNVSQLFGELISIVLCKYRKCIQI